MYWRNNSSHVAIQLQILLGLTVSSLRNPVVNFVLYALSLVAMVAVDEWISVWWHITCFRNPFQKPIKKAGSANETTMTTRLLMTCWFNLMMHPVTTKLEMCATLALDGWSAVLPRFRFVASKEYMQTDSFTPTRVKVGWWLPGRQSHEKTGLHSYCL